MGDDITQLVGAIKDLVKVTQENSTRLQEFIEGGTRPQPTKSIEDLQNDNPITKIHEYLVQRMVKMQGHETWENVQKFVKESEAKAFMVNNKGTHRMLIESRYTSTPVPTTPLNPNTTPTDGE